MSSKRPSLGKGLSALLGESLPPAYEAPVGEVTMLSVHKLKAGQYQPRSYFDDEKLASLIESIREKGVLQPLIVRHTDGNDAYEIIAGERRWRAAKTLNMTDVPVIIRDCSDTEALELAIIENVQRDDLNPLEEAEAYQKLMTQFSYTQENVAKHIGKSRSYVANMLRLNNLPSNIKILILEGKISSGHARALLSVENAESLADDIISQNLNVRDVEKKVKALKREKSEQNGVEEKNDDIASLEQQMSHLFQTPVSIHLKKDKGHIAIHFNSFDQMDDLVQSLRTHRHEPDIA